MTIPARRAGRRWPWELHNRRCEGEAVEVCDEMAGAQGGGREAAAGQAAAGAQCYCAGRCRAGTEAHGRTLGAASRPSSSVLRMNYDNDGHIVILLGITDQKKCALSVD